jgi:hypothetical protein
MNIDIARRQERYSKFYADPRPGQLLVLLGYGGGPETEPHSFFNYDFTRESEHRRYWDYLVRNFPVPAADRADLDDDTMPAIELGYGFGSFGAVYCDRPLTFTETTSYIDSALDNLEDMDALDLSADRLWSRMFVEAERYLSEQSQGRFLVGVYPNPSPLDVANLLRGNAIFTDVYEQPELFKRFLEKCLAAAIENARRIERVTCNSGGGTISFGRWIPRGALLLEDAADLISPKLYREFGLPYTQRLLDAFGGAYLHHHSLGRHQFANMAALRGLYVEQISSDPGCARPVTYVEEIFERVRSADGGAGLAVDLECTPEEVYENIERLKLGKVILSVHTANKDEARRLLHFVREHSPVLN